jgi:glycosyltransferase involved in cell wall biosynthesis
MKILAIHSHFPDTPSPAGVDMWRISRPIRELEKHVDWQIDHQRTAIPGFEQYKDTKDFTEAELEKAFKKICEYDIVFTSYHADRAAYALYGLARAKAGTQLVMDADDDFFSINEDNPYWMKMDDEKTWWLQVMARHNPYLTTTTEALAEAYRLRRRQDPDKHPDDSVMVVPNFIPDQYKEYDPNSGNKIVIGYFGGASHYDDLHETGVHLAIEKLMHENKRVHFKSVGMPMDKYLPKARSEYVEGKRGDPWIDELFPTLNMDIAIAPLVDNTFNHGKSNIKWQEATRGGAAFVASDIGPYSMLKKGTALLVKNDSEEWYKALKALVQDTEKRKKQVAQARKELKKYRLEDNWHILKEVFERVHNDNKTS